MSLIYLDLSNNSLSGIILPWIMSLVNMEHSKLRSNNCGENIPAAIGCLCHLKDLDFSLNFLSGSIPPFLGYLSALNYLSLSDNSLTGGIPKEMLSFETLIASDNSLVGSILLGIGKLVYLKY
ncbi:hypothetical protein AMTR_s00097p00135970 [Amborella trichopoda]|uniref:Leucine-rich repeat-containing N-terminal plant-type domain-containing protein n=1 Tax=Amborella trichopoda TaxID=13333 RepID=W1P1G3_AMBTC|nr:hypothetical protein AMTR_s00097p00135970 [Amborella trichopoda]